MHLVFNAGTSDKYFGWCDIICKGTGKRIISTEKNRWDKDFYLSWQKKLWVDSVVMRDISQKFVAHKNEVHGEGVWVIMFCDNLSAHLDHDAKQTYSFHK